jgi:hypothetical protein
MALTDKLTTIAENEEKVFEAGRKAEYDFFWDNFQDNGNRTLYNYGFASHFGWNEENLKPKYNVVPKEANYIFYGFRFPSLNPFFKDRGIKLDFGNCTNMSAAFIATQLIEIDEVNLSSAGGNLANVFSGNTKLKKIGKLIVAPTTKFATTSFNGCSALEEVGFEGEIVNSIHFGQCRSLTHDGIMNIVDALETKTNGATATLTLGSYNLPKLSTTEKAIITDEKGWSLA